MKIAITEYSNGPRILSYLSCRQSTHVWHKDPNHCGIKNLIEIWGFHGVEIQVMVFWVVTRCSVAVGYQGFGGSRCFHVQGEVNVTSPARCSKILVSYFKNYRKSECRRPWPGDLSHCWFPSHSCEKYLKYSVVYSVPLFVVPRDLHDIFWCLL